MISRILRIRRLADRVITNISRNPSRSLCRKTSLNSQARRNTDTINSRNSNRSRFTSRPSRRFSNPSLKRIQLNIRLNLTAQLARDVVKQTILKLLTTHRSIGKVAVRANNSPKVVKEGVERPVNC